MYSCCWINETGRADARPNPPLLFPLTFRSQIPIEQQTCSELAVARLHWVTKNTARQATSSGRRSARSADGLSRSSRGRTRRKASMCCPVAGWLKAHWPGSTALGVSPRTSNRPSYRQLHGSPSPRSSFSPGVSQGTKLRGINLNQALRFSLRRSRLKAVCLQTTDCGRQLF